MTTKAPTITPVTRGCVRCGGHEREHWYCFRADLDEGDGDESRKCDVQPLFTRADLDTVADAAYNHAVEHGWPTGKRIVAALLGEVES